MYDLEEPLIYKYDLLKFLRTLRREARHIYSVLTGAPIDCVWIWEEEDDTEGKRTFAVNDFLSQYNRFKSNRDRFCLCFKTYYFREEWSGNIPAWQLLDTTFNGEDIFSIDYKSELSIDTLSKELPHLLAHLCRRAILNNTPLLLTDKTTKKQYGFTRTDIEKLRDVIIRCNLWIVAELRAEYDKLGAIDWIREQPSPAIMM